jgi:hypothetical protein
MSRTIALPTYDVEYLDVESIDVYAPVFVDAEYESAFDDAAGAVSFIVRSF